MLDPRVLPRWRCRQLRWVEARWECSWAEHDTPGNANVSWWPLPSDAFSAFNSCDAGHHQFAAGKSLGELRTAVL